MGSQLIADLFQSLDGWAGSAGLPAYFGYAGPDLDAWIAAELAKEPVLVMGRRTYEMLAGLPDDARDDSWERMTELDKLVVSRSLTQADWANTRVIRHDAIDAIGRMKADELVSMRTIGSLSLVRQLMSAQLVDVLRLMIFPVIAGDQGREPALGGLAAADLELVNHQALDGRVLLVEYRPTGRAIPQR